MAKRSTSFQEDREVVDLTGEIHPMSDEPNFKGVFSDVHCGLYNGKEVAVKVIKRLQTPKDTMQRKLRREGKVWAGLKHQNILPLYGFARDWGELGAFISPWYRNGDAATYLSVGEGSSLGFDGRLSLWLAVTEGVDYLHSKRIIHGDLKPRNIIIDDQGIPKICDFGLVRVFFEEGGSGMTTTSPYFGTRRYVSPEILEDGAMPTGFSDIWALGCIGLEVVYRTIPYFGKADLGALAALAAGIKPGTRPTELSHTDEFIWDIFEQCWSKVLEDRPTAAFICECFNQEEPEPIQVPLPGPVLIESPTSTRSNTRSSQIEDGLPNYTAASGYRPSASRSQSRSENLVLPIRGGSSTNIQEGQLGLLNQVAQELRLLVDWDDESTGQSHNPQWKSVGKINGTRVCEGRAPKKQVARNQAAGFLMNYLGERCGSQSASYKELAEQLRKLLE